jgi:hypothetical protein
LLHAGGAEYKKHIRNGVCHAMPKKADIQCKHKILCDAHRGASLSEKYLFISIYFIKLI